MRTDTIFYSLFQEFPSIFFELINRSPDEAVAYEFTSREVKQLAFRLDGLFLPTTNEPDKPVYLVEVQFQPDPDLYYRLFDELFVYLKQYKPPHPWRIVAIYPNRSTEREQTLHFGQILTLESVRRIYLDELGEAAENSLGVGVVKLVIEPEATAVQLARRLVEQAKQQLTDEVVQKNLINLIETIIVYKLPQKSREEIEAMFGLSELKQTKVYQEAKQEGLEEGRLEGKQEGLEEGERQAKLQAIARLLPMGLSVDQIAQALDLPLAVVQQTAEQIRSQTLLFAQQNVAAFIVLLNEQRSLFSPDDLTELYRLVTSLPDQIEELSQTLSNWSENRSEILDAKRQLIESLSNDSRAESPNKQTLINAIGQTSSSGDSQSSNTTS